MKKLEIILGSIAALAIVLKLKLLLQLNGDNAVFFYALTSLSLFYFLFSFALFNSIRFRDVFKRTSYSHTNAKRISGAIVVGAIISIITTGALFKLLLLSGATKVILVGLTAMIVLLIIAIVFYFRSKAAFYVSILKRMAIFGGLAFVLLLTPNATLIGIYYSDYPGYVELYKKVNANPDDDELRHRLEQMEEDIHRQASAVKISVKPNNLNPSK